MKQIKVIIKKPYQTAIVKEIDNDFQLIKKMINTDMVESASAPYDGDVKMLLDEDGKCKMLAGNFMVPEFRDCIVGTCVFISCDEDGETIGLNDKQIERTLKYLKDYELHNGEYLYFEMDYLLNKATRKMLSNRDSDLC